MRLPEEMTDAELMFEILRKTGWKDIEIEDRNFYQEVKGSHPVYARSYYAGEWLMYDAKGRLEEMIVKDLPTRQQLMYVYALSKKIIDRIRELGRGNSNEISGIVDECAELKNMLGLNSDYETGLLVAYAMLAATPREGAEALYSVLQEEKEAVPCMAAV